MSHEQSCPACGSSLPPNAADGLCTKCLLNAGLEQAAGDGHLHVRCPHCQNPIEFVEEIPLRDITCPSCDSKFSLVGDETTIATWDESARIGQFELIEQVGVGSFGSVWKARDTQLDRTVAVKVPRRDQISEVDVEQFLREARAAAQLKHPNIVSVHEVGRSNGQVYIVSDFIDGLTLADWLGAHHLTPPETASLCAHLAAALHHAHEAGVIHRDLKPSNIMIDAGGEPHIMDFGLAKREAGEITMTVDGKVLGTPAYMSPEQARGEAHEADARSDVYSLGVIMFEMLTGEKPFRGTSRMLLHQVIHDDAPQLRKLNGVIPRDLDTVCLKCLEKEPGRRYATAADVCDELQRFMKHEPILARPITSWERGIRWSRRNPILAALGTAVALLLVSIAVASPIVAWRESVLKSQAVARAEENRQLLYLSDMNLASQAWKNADIEYLGELLNRHRPRSNEADLRGFEWHYLWRQSQGTQRTFETRVGIDTLRFLPDGASLVGAARPLDSWGSQESTSIWDLETDKERPIPKALVGKMVLGIAPDGSTAAVVRDDNTVAIVNVLTGDQTAALEIDSAVRSLVHISPDHRSAVTVSPIEEKKTCLLRRWNLETGAVTARKTLNGAGAYALSCGVFSPNGRILALSGCVYLGKEGDIQSFLRLFDAVTLEQQAELTGHTHIVWETCFSPDGKVLASASFDRTVKLWDVRSGAELGTLSGHSNWVRGVAFSPDGNTLASAGHDGRIILWDTAERTSKQVLKGHTGPVETVVFSPDGQLLCSTGHDSTVKVWDLTEERSADRLDGHKAFVFQVAFSPDGKTLASSSLDTTVKLWNVATGRMTASLSTGNPVLGIAFSADGKMIAAAEISDVDNKIVFWNVATQELVQELPSSRYPIRAIAISPDGSILVSATQSDIRVWDLATRSEFKRLRGHEGEVNSLAFSPDGATLASGAQDGSVRLWDVTSWREIKKIEMPPHQTNRVAFSPDGTKLAVGSNTLNLYDVRTTALLYESKGHSSWTGSLAFSPDGGTLVSVGGDNLVILWDVATGKRRCTFEDHTEPVYGVAFSPDGKTLATGSFDQSVRLYRTANATDTPDSGGSQHAP